MSRRGEADSTFNLSNSDIYDVMRSVLGSNSIPRYADTNSSARNVPYTGVTLNAYDALQNSERNTTSEVYSGNNVHLPSLVNSERNASSLLQEHFFNTVGAYNTSDSSALEAAIQGLRSSQSAPRQDWNQEYSQSNRLKELFNLERSQTLSESPKNIPSSSNLLNQIFDAESSVASSDAASAKPFNDLNLNTVDEEDEFLYGDSNSLPEIPKSVKDNPVENKKVLLGTGWSDDEDPYEDMSSKEKSVPAHSVWEARNRGEITQQDKLSTIKQEKREKASPRTPAKQFLPPAVKEAFTASPQRGKESNQKIIPSGVSSHFKTEKQSKYHAAAEILKNKILEKTRLVTESNSGERVISEIAESLRKVSETDSRITNKSSKMLDSNRPDFKTDKVPENQQKHLPKALVQKDIENIKNYIKGSSGKRILPGEELDQESKHFRYEPARKVSPPRHYPPHEVIRHDYMHQPPPHIRPPNVQRLPSPHLSRPPNVEHEKKALESRYRSLEKHRQYSHSPEKQRGSHDKSPGHYRHRMKSPGPQRSKRSRSPGSQRLKRSRSPGSQRLKRSRSPGYYRSRRSRSPPSHRPRGRSRSPRRHRSRSPRSYRSHERSKSPRRRKSQERNTVHKGKSVDKTKKSLPVLQKKPDKKKKSRDDSSSSSSSSSFCSMSFESSSSDSSFESSSRKERDIRKKELLKKKAVLINDTKNKITEGSTKSPDVADVKNTATATPPEDIAKKISDIFSSPRDAPSNSSTTDPEQIQKLVGLIEDCSKNQYLNEIFQEFTQNRANCSTVQDYSTFPVAVPGDVPDPQIPVIPSSEPYAYPSTLYPQPAQVNYPHVPSAAVPPMASQYNPYSQYTYDVPNVINIIPQPQLPDFAVDSLRPVKTKAPKIRNSTLRQIEVSNNITSRPENSSNKFDSKKSASDTSAKNLSHTISRESFEKKKQEIKEKQLMKNQSIQKINPETDSAVESNDKGNKNQFIERYKKLEADKKLKQQRLKTATDDVAEMLKIINRTFGKKSSASEKLIQSKCKDLFHISNDVFNSILTEVKQADENLKKFKTEIPLEFEKDVLSTKVDLTEEEATDEVYTCFDSGDHICFPCSEKFTSIANMMDHIQSVEHKKQAALDNSWKAFFMQDKNKIDVTSKKKSDKLQAVQGIEFMKPLTGYFCDLCKETHIDKTSAEQHLKSHTHFVNFKSFMKKNPLYERKCLLKRYVQITESTKKKRQKEMEEKKRLLEEKKKREEEANEKAKAIINSEKSREIKVEELEDSEVISVSNSQSSANIKVNLSSTEIRPQKESEAKPAAKPGFIGKAPNYKKSQTTPKNKAMPWYKRESYLKKTDDVREEKSSETKEKPLISEKKSFSTNNANVGNLSQSKNFEQNQNVIHESNTSKKDDNFDTKLSKSKSGQCESNTSKKDKDVNRYSPSDIFSQKLPNSASSASSVHQDIPLPKEKPSKPSGQPSKVEEKSVPMDIDNSQDTSFKPSVPLSEEEKDYMLLGIHKDDLTPMVIPVPPPNQGLSYSNPVGGTQTSSYSNPVEGTQTSSYSNSVGGSQTSVPHMVDVSVPPPTATPYENNRPPISMSFPVSQSNTQSVGLYSYQQNSNPSMSMYSNTCNMQAVSSFTNVPPPSFTNHPTGTYPINAYHNHSNMPYAQQQQQYPPRNMSPIQAFPNTNRFSVPPPVPGSPHAYAPQGGNPPSYPIQNNAPAHLSAAPQTFGPPNNVCNPSFSKNTAVSPTKPIIQPKTKSNLIEIVPSKNQVPLNRSEKVIESVKRKETENFPVSSTSRTSLDDGKNIKKDSSQNHTKMISNLEELGKKDEKNKNEESYTKSLQVKKNSENIPVSSTSKVTDDSSQNLTKTISDSEKSGKDAESKIVESVKEKETSVSFTSEVTNIETGLDDGKNTKGGSSPNNENEISVITVKRFTGKNRKTGKQNVRKKTVKSQIESVTEDISDDDKLKNPCTSDEGLPGDLSSKESESGSKSVKEKESTENVPVSSTSEVTADSSQNLTKITSNLGKSDQVPGKLSTKSENLDDTENNEISVITVKRLKGKNKQNVRNDTIKLVVSVSEDISDDENFKKTFTSDECLPDDSTNRTGEDSKIVENKSKISDPSDCSKNLTDSIKSSDKELSLGDCVKDIKGSEIGDSASISEDCEIIYDEPAQGNQKPKPKATRKRKLVKQRIQPARKQTSASSSNIGAQGSHLGKNTGKKLKENQEENQVLSSYLQNVVDVREEYNKVSGVEKFKMSMAVSKFYEELQESAIDSGNIQKESENVASQASTEPNLKVKENFEEKSLLTATNSCRSEDESMKLKEKPETQSLPSSEHEPVPTDQTLEKCSSSLSGNEILPDIATEITSLGKEETSEMINPPANEAMEVENVEEPNSSGNISESFNLPSTGKEEISKMINPPVNQVMEVENVLEPDSSETLNLPTTGIDKEEKISEIISPPANCIGKEEISEMINPPVNEVMEVENVEEPDSSRNVSETLNLPTTGIDKEEKISEIISPSATCNETMPDIQTEMNSLAKEETSSPNEEKHEDKEVETFNKLDSSENPSETLNVPSADNNKAEVEKVYLVEQPDSGENSSETPILPSAANKKAELEKGDDSVEQPDSGENSSEAPNLSSIVDEHLMTMMTEIDSWAESGSSPNGSDTDEYEQET